MPRRLFIAVLALVVSGSHDVSAQQEGTAPTARQTRAASPSLLLPGARPDVLTTIRGNALNSMNRALPNVLVRLRDARMGRIVDTQLTDRAGLFAFYFFDPGSYIVELLSSDSRVLAASQLLHVNAGEVVSTVVKLPFRISPLGDLLGHSAQSAATIATAAATAGVLASTVTGQPASP